LLDAVRDLDLGPIDPLPDLGIARRQQEDRDQQQVEKEQQQHESSLAARAQPVFQVE
jgi:hypothetical protein